MPYQIPDQFYRESWEDADHPMACVGVDNRFVRVNAAFERMLGYSSSELEGRSWMEFTNQKHVGGDLASVEAVIEGKIDGYQLEKEYIHKRGHMVPIVLHVRRFPRSSHVPLLYFRVETPFAGASRIEMEKLKKEMEQKISELHEQMDSFKNNSLRVNVGNQIEGNNNTGGNKNSNSAITSLVGAFIVLAMTMAWLFYYVSTIKKDVSPQPPTLQTESGSNQKKTFSSEMIE